MIPTISKCTNCGYRVGTRQPAKTCPRCTTILNHTGMDLVEHYGTYLSPPPPESALHWNRIHTYPVENYHNWCPIKAEQFYKDWEDNIPASCGCSTKWKDHDFELKKLGYLSPEDMFIRSVNDHSKVSTEHVVPAKPAMNIIEAMGKYKFPIDTRWDRLIITFAEKSHQDIWNITKKSVEKYAEKCGAVLICIEDDMYPYNSMINKWRISSYAWHAERTLYIDSDIIITEDAPDVFDTHQEGTCIVDGLQFVGDWKHYYIKEAERVFASQGLNYRLGDKSPNGGVVLFNDANVHEAYKEPPMQYPMYWCTDEFWLDYTMRQGKVTWMDSKFNWAYVGRDFWMGIRDAWFIHLNGCKPLSFRLELAKRIANGNLNYLPKHPDTYDYNHHIPNM